MGQESLFCPHSLKLFHLQLIWGQQITQKTERTKSEDELYLPLTWHQTQTYLDPVCSHYQKMWSGERNNENNKLRMKTTWARPAIFLIILVFVNIKQWPWLCVKLCREIGRPILKTKLSAEIISAGFLCICQRSSLFKAIRRNVTHFLFTSNSKCEI